MSSDASAVRQITEFGRFRGIVQILNKAVHA